MALALADRPSTRALPDLTLVPAQPRIDFIKCQTPWCKSPLGVREAHGVVHWRVYVDHNYATGETKIPCPHCGAERIWRPKN